MLRRVRISSQILFFTLFCAIFFIVNKFPHPYSHPSDLFLRLNPLVALLSEIASRKVIPSVLIIGGSVALLTIVFGRFFCGFICPLGSSIDLVDRFVFGKIRSTARLPKIYLQRLKYVLLISLFVLALFGALFPLFMDPISLFVRIFALVINPLLTILGLTTVSATGPLLRIIGLENLTYATIVVPLFYGVFVATLLFAIILAGSFWDRRFWCQYVCPSGAFFGLLSRFPLFRRRTLDTTCNSCSRCARVCPTRAIDKQQVGRTSSSECIVCGLCTSLKDDCAHFSFSAPNPESIAAPDLHRRHIVLGIAGGALLVPSFRATAITKADGKGRLVRPPGAVPESEFISRCIACGNCMKACPTNVLQPCTITDGLQRLYTPKLVPRIGFCDSKCNLCAFVCPTGAISRYPIEEKPFIKIGTAVIDRQRCLAWAQKKECLVCDESCPFNAIEPRMVETVKGPFKAPIVWEDRCMGCGICEQKCPIFDEAAIIVYRFGENRKSQGPYMTESQKKKMTEQRNASTNNIHEVTKESGGLQGFDLTPASPSPGEGPSPSAGSALPPGFSE